MPPNDYLLNFDLEPAGQGTTQPPTSSQPDDYLSNFDFQTAMGLYPQPSTPNQSNQSNQPDDYLSNLDLQTAMGLSTQPSAPSQNPYDISPGGETPGGEDPWGSPPQQCSDVYGPGWTGNYPNCEYQSEEFAGDVESLGFRELLPPGSWNKYFDAYDTTEENMLLDQTGRQLGDLQTAWDLRGRGLRDQTGSAYEQAFGLGEQGAKKSGMAFSGTIADRARKARSQVGQGYKSMMTGQLADLFSQKTNIYSGLQSGVFGLRRRWEDEQRDNLNALLGSDIWGGNYYGGVSGKGRGSGTPSDPGDNSGKVTIFG
jgi:hypothetical protein